MAFYTSKESARWHGCETKETAARRLHGGGTERFGAVRGDVRGEMAKAPFLRIAGQARPSGRSVFSRPAIREAWHRTPERGNR